MPGRTAVLDQAALRAAASARRRRILRLIWDRELPSAEIASHLSDITWQAVSLNLRVLKEARLVLERREGTRRFYRADRKRCAPLEPVLRAMWQQDLAGLASVVRADRAGKRR